MSKNAFCYDPCCITLIHIVASHSSAAVVVCAANDEGSLVLPEVWQQLHNSNEEVLISVVD